VLYPLAELTFGRVHAKVRQSVRFLVELAANVLDFHLVELTNHQPGTRMERLQPGILDLVLATHLLHQQLGVRADLHAALLVINRPLQRGEQAVVFGDIVRRDAQPAVQLVNERAVGGFDPDTVPRRTRIATGPAVYVSDNHQRGQEGWAAPPEAGAT
jgi:hypothetical protein